MNGDQPNRAPPSPTTPAQSQAPRGQQQAQAGERHPVVAPCAGSLRRGAAGRLSPRRPRRRQLTRRRAGARARRRAGLEPGRAQRREPRRRERPERRRKRPSPGHGHTHSAAGGNAHRTAGTQGCRARHPLAPGRDADRCGQGRRRATRGLAHRPPRGGRKQRERVAVGVAPPGVADAEVQVRGGRGAPAGRARGAEPGALPHPIALDHRGRGEVQIRRVEAPVGGPHRHGEPGRAGHAREGDGPGRRGADRCTGRRGDVDPAVLAARVGVVAVSVRRDHLAGDGPGPARGRAREGEAREQRGEEQAGEHGRRRYARSSPLWAGWCRVVAGSYAAVTR